MKKNILILCALLSFDAYAERQSGEITGVIPYQSGPNKLFFVQLTSNVVEGCNGSGRFVLEGTKLSYNENVSLLIAAYFSKTPMQIEYTKTCNAWGNAYDINYVCVGSIPC